MRVVGRPAFSPPEKSRRRAAPGKQSVGGGALAVAILLTFRQSIFLSRQRRARSCGRSGLVSGGGRPPGWLGLPRWVKSLLASARYVSEPGGDIAGSRGVRVDARGADGCSGRA